MAKELKFKQGSYKEALDYFKQKINLPTKRWNDLEGAMHTRAFVVAGAMRKDILLDFRKAVEAAIENGESLQDFRDRFYDIASKWRESDPSFDEKMQKPKYGAWRSKVIYQTNILTSAAAAQERQARSMPDVFTHAKYVCMMMPTSREQHKAWNGTVLPLNDPWWETHSPPNGFGCLCEKEFISKYEMDSGLEKVTMAPTSPKDTSNIGENWDYSINDADMGKVGLFHKPGSWQLANQKGLWESSKEHYPKKVPVFDAPKRTEQTESLDKFSKTFMQRLHEEFDGKGNISVHFDKDEKGMTILKQIGNNTYPIRIDPEYLGRHFYKDSKDKEDYKKRVSRTTLINFFIETLKNPGHIRTEFLKDNTKKVSIDMTFYSEFKEKNRIIPIKFAFKSVDGNLLSWTAYDADIPIRAKGVIMK